MCWRCFINLDETGLFRGFSAKCKGVRKSLAKLCGSENSGKQYAEFKFRVDGLDVLHWTIQNTPAPVQFAEKVVTSHGASYFFLLKILV